MKITFWLVVGLVTGVMLPLKSNALDNQTAQNSPGSAPTGSSELLSDTTNSPKPVTGSTKSPKPVTGSTNPSTKPTTDVFTPDPSIKTNSTELDSSPSTPTTPGLGKTDEKTETPTTTNPNPKSDSSTTGTTPTTDNKMSPMTPTTNNKMSPTTSPKLNEQVERLNPLPSVIPTSSKGKTDAPKTSGQSDYQMNGSPISPSSQPVK